MPKLRVLPDGPGQTAWRQTIPVSAPCTEEAPAPRHVVNVDDLCASPWVGLHYRHEFLLHHGHELLVQHLKD